MRSTNTTSSSKPVPSRFFTASTTGPASTPTRSPLASDSTLTPHRLPVPISTSFSLSIPFFSRSSSSATSTTTASTSPSTDIDLGSYSFGYDYHHNLNHNHIHDHLLGVSGSGPYTLSDRSKSGSGSINSGSSRPGLRKMPSWASWSVSRTSSEEEGIILSEPPTSRDYGMDVNMSTNMSMEDSVSSEHGQVTMKQNDRGADRMGMGDRAMASRLRADLGTWGKSPKVILGFGIGKSRYSTTNASSGTVSKLRLRSSPKPKLAQIVPSSPVVQGFPLTRVRAQAEENGAANVVSGEMDMSVDRERRGSDWPPTQARDMDMILDASRLQTLTSDFTHRLNLSSDASDVGCPILSIDKPSDLSKIHATVEGVDVELERDRVDTPLEMPIIPRLGSRSRSSILSPVQDDEEEDEEEEAEEEKAEEEEGGKSKQDQESVETKEEEEQEEFYTPSPLPSSLFAAAAYPSRLVSLGGQTEDSPVFNVNIFSPRPPPPPVIKGISDALPISPLELPQSDLNSIITSSSFINPHSYPTPVLPRGPPPSPLCMPVPRRGCAGESIEHVLHPSSLRRSSITGRTGGAERPRRPSIPGISKRRTSILFKPSVLPCPTPPSLLTSPKSLGSEYIPPLFSPSSFSPVNSRFSANVNSGSNLSVSTTSTLSLSLSVTTTSVPGEVSSSIPRRRGRGSMRLKLPPSHLSEREAGLGLGMSRCTADEDNEKEEHVATPGTFGLEGGKEKLEVAGMNPYFA